MDKILGCGCPNYSSHLINEFENNTKYNNDKINNYKFLHITKTGGTSIEEFALKLGLINSQSIITHYGAKNKLLSYKEALRKTHNLKIKKVKV